SLKILINMDAKTKDETVFSLKETIEGGKELLKMGNRYFLDAQIDRDRMGEILFTSGTTGVAKGVMLSQGNIVEDLMAAPTLLKVEPEDIFFSVLPIHHTYECTCGFLMPIYKGASVAYCEGLKYIVKNLSEVRPTMFLGVPLIFESLYKKIWQNAKKTGKEKMLKKMIAINNKTKKVGINLGPLFLKQITALFGGRMRMMICGGAAIDPTILQGLRDFGIMALQGYGLTECAPICALNPDRYSKNTSAGYPLPGFDVKIHEPDPDTGIGEICTKGANVMLGYYKDPEGTAEVLKDGWFYTGDLGYLDEESYVFITGRRKNVIITKNGKNVFPEEIEYYINKIPYVEESLVWAKESKDGGDTIIAATLRIAEEEVKEQLGEKGSMAALEALLWKEMDCLNKELPYFKRIKKIVVKKTEFEKTTGKKIKRFVESNKGE
ncbi:MAG: AMP-binding protein, partial [Anaerovorax sp.]